MRINYREPYWVNFKWEMESHHKNQYVTEYNKEENDMFKEFQHLDSFIIICEFKIGEDYKTDKISMVYGKPGKNLGLSYNSETQMIAFEFWTTKNGEDHFYNIPFKKVTVDEIRNGVTTIVIRDNDKISLYTNFELDNMDVFVGNMINDYKLDPLYIGCSNPGTIHEKHRYHGEVEMNYLSIITNESSFDYAKDLYHSRFGELIKKEYYKNILCLYDFKTVNNLGIVYDESKNSNFLEKMPKDFVK